MPSAFSLLAIAGPIPLSAERLTIFVGVRAGILLSKLIKRFKHVRGRICMSRLYHFTAFVLCL